MASCQTTRWVSTAPYVRLIVNENKSTSTATISKLDWALYYISDTPAQASARTYTVKINGSVPANGSGSYNINGVTGTKKIAGGTVSINKSANSKSVSFFVSFPFKLSWSGHYQDTLTASGKINIPAITSYTIIYNANGGTSAPPAQTKRHGSSITLSSAKPDRDGYIFQGWSDSTSGTVKYHPGDTYSQNGNATLYAIWQQAIFTISYDANGGTGAPDSQTKNYGEDITLSNGIPSRTGYEFLGWGITANDPSVVYAVGGKYTSNASIVLYAVWKFTYTNPRIKNIITNRCTIKPDPDNMIYIPGLNITIPGIIITPVDGGELGSISFDWETDYPTTSVTLRYKMQTSSEWTTETVTDTTDDAQIVFNKDRKGGTSKCTIATDDPYASYAVQIEVVDSFGSSRISRILPGLVYTMDFADGGKSVGIGCIAPDIKNGESGMLEIGFQTKLTGGLAHIEVPYADLNDVKTPGFYASRDVNDGGKAYYTNMPPIDNMIGTFSLEVYSAGNISRLLQRFTKCDKKSSAIYERFYYENSWGDWILVYPEEVTSGTIDYNSSKQFDNDSDPYRDDNHTLYLKQYSDASNRFNITCSGNIVTMAFRTASKTNVNAGTSYVLGTIPESFRPSNIVSTSGLFSIGTTVYNSCAIWVRANGQICVKPYNTDTSANPKFYEANLVWDLKAVWNKE